MLPMQNRLMPRQLRVWYPWLRKVSHGWPSFKYYLTFLKNTETA